jgi:SPP1 gp7 family putative phage head morphogenesis protein
VKTTLQPLIHRDRYTSLVEQELVAHLTETVYTPLLDLLRNSQLRVNENKEHSAVWDALIAGTLWYASGVFTGQFNAAISRELRAMGAKLTPAGFALPLEEVPLVLRGVLSKSAHDSDELHSAVLALLLTQIGHIEAAATGLRFSDTVDKVVEDLQEQAVRSVSAEPSLPPPAEIPPNLPRELEEGMTRETSRQIKRFSLEQLHALRAKVSDNLLHSGRTDRLVGLVRSSLGAAQRKAHGIAEAAAGYLVAQFREKSALGLGATEYVWVTSHDERVRADHRDLDGLTFSWSNPPIANRATGFRGHPGEAANCRCSARPVINFA